MSAHLERARLLLAQSRPADAEREVMLALASEPADAHALALLAISRSEQKNHPAALAAATEAVGLAPDAPYLHYVHALVLHRHDRDDEAAVAVAEALRLDPHDADLFSLRASIELARRNWPAALESAEQGLAINPEHVEAANLRSMALVRLGRKAEAMEAIDFALARDPENAFSHANQGWNCLHRNDPRQAQEHFREALRLNPGLDYAREGMLQALKARNPIYRGMLAYFLWSARLSGQAQWAFIIAVWFGTRFVRQLATQHPEQGWLWWSLLVLLYGFIYLSWTAQPMFNLLLRFNRFGRHVLSDDQRVASTWYGGLLGAALAAGVWGIFGGGALAILLLAGFIVLSICVAATFAQSEKKRRKLALATVALAAVGVAAFGCLLAGRDELAAGFGSIFTLGFLAFQFLANVLVK